jgi:hypothetical protein
VRWLALLPCLTLDVGNELPSKRDAAPNASEHLVRTLAIHIIGVVILASPEVNCVVVSSATSLGHLAWCQLSTPSPPTPAGDITVELIRIWWNHVLEVEIPRFPVLQFRRRHLISVFAGQPLLETIDEFAYQAGSMTTRRTVRRW